MEINVIYGWIIPVIVAIVGVLRGAIPWLSKRPKLLPLVSIIVGMLLAAIAVNLAPPEAATMGKMFATWAITGLIGGLMAAGGWDAGSAVKTLTK